MGRIKPAWYYERKATIASARETYLKNNPPSPPAGTIEQRGASNDLYYRSLLMTDGTDPLIYKVSVPVDTLTKFNGDVAAAAALVGLKTTLGAGEIALRLRGSGVKPSRIHWYEGATTPTRSKTPWGSSVSKYYADRIYSCPLSEATGVFSAHNLRADFEDLFGIAGSHRSLLGDKNGRAWLDFESAPLSYST